MAIEDVHSMMNYGIAAARAGETASAQRYFNRVVTLARYPEDRVKAWLWLARLSDDPAIQRHYYQRVLDQDPVNPEAKRNLAILDGTLNAQDIIDPDALPSQSSPQTPQPAQADRVTCPQCGGWMRLDAESAKLVCRHCGHQRPTDAKSETLAEHDFVLTLVTAKGHQTPPGTHAFQCQGCQATLIASKSLTETCPYCGSAHVVQTSSRELVPPEGVIPFQVAQEAAQHAFHHWLRELVQTRSLDTGQVSVGHLHSLYIPAWTFDLTGQAQSSIGGSTHRTTFTLDDLLVSASRTLPPELAAELEHFNLVAATPYDPAYLADWATEVYSIPVSEASIEARRITVQRSVNQRITNLAVISYKLVLLPFWLARYRYAGEIYTVVINGQTQNVRGQKPPQASWIEGLFRRPRVR